MRGIPRISGWVRMLARVLERGFCGLSADSSGGQRRGPRQRAAMSCARSSVGEPSGCCSAVRRWSSLSRPLVNICPVPRFDAPSRCSGPSSPTFRWYGYPQCPVGDDLDTAVDVLMAAVSPPGRVWNPWSGTIVRREFRRRIERAAEGDLKPIDEVKPVDITNPPPFYEIRWQGIAVTEMQDDGSQTFGQVIVRMYHSEPPAVPEHFIGHHAHEKNVTVDDVNAAQNDEISTAIGWYEHGIDSNWGIAVGERSL